MPLKNPVASVVLGGSLDPFVAAFAIRNLSRVKELSYDDEVMVGRRSLESLLIVWPN